MRSVQIVITDRGKLWAFMSDTRRPVRGVFLRVGNGTQHHSAAEADFPESSQMPLLVAWLTNQCHLYLY